ncbi:MAG: YgaP family membrane protein [Thermoanaerobaculia bacterium]
MRWRNEANWDRLLRILAGFVFVVLGLAGAIGEPAATALSIFGWVPLLTGLLGWCPIYSLFDVGTGRR